MFTPKAAFSKSEATLRRTELGVVWVIIFILFLFFLMVVADKAIFQRFSRDAEFVKSLCAARSNSDLICLSFWYRTLLDPSVAWNFWYSVLTMSLVIGAIVSIHNDRVRRADTQKFFELDQRPWIRVEIKLKSKIDIFRDRMIIRAVVTLRNVGKSPAFQVTRGWFFIQHPSRNMLEFWNRTRADIDSRMEYMGRTILPGEEIENEETIDIPSSEIELSQTVAGLSTGMTVVSYKYRSQFSNNLHESSRMYCVFVGGGMPLHMITNLYREQEGITTSALGVFEITS